MTWVGVGVTCHRTVLSPQEGLSALQIADKLYDPHSRKKVKDLLNSGGELDSANGVSGSHVSWVTVTCKLGDCHM